MAHLLDEALRERAAARPAEARTPCLQALAIIEQKQGSSADAVAILSILSTIRLDLSDYPVAHDVAQRSAAMVADFGVDEHDASALAQLRINTIANLARVERTLGRVDQAEKHYLDAIAATEKLAVLITKVYGRVFAPALAELDPRLPTDLAHRSELAHAWRQLDRRLNQFTNAALTAA